MSDDSAVEAARRILAIDSDHIDSVDAIAVADAYLSYQSQVEKVHAFLMGEGTLDGRGFGDDPPVINGRKHPYWWRTHLRAALTPKEEK